MNKKLINFYERIKASSWLSEYEKAKNKTHYQHKVDKLAIPGMEANEINDILINNKIIDKDGFILNSKGNRAIDQTPNIDHAYGALYEYKLDHLAKNPPEDSFDIDEEQVTPEDYKLTDKEWDIFNSIMMGTYNPSQDEIYLSNREFFQDKVWASENLDESKVKELIRNAITKTETKIQPDSKQFSWKFPFSKDAVTQMKFVINPKPKTVTNGRTKYGLTTITWKLPQEIAAQMPEKMELYYTNFGGRYLIISTSIEDVHIFMEDIKKQSKKLGNIIYPNTTTHPTRKKGNSFVMKTPRGSEITLRHNMDRFASSGKNAITPRIHQDRFIIVEAPKKK